MNYVHAYWYISSNFGDNLVPWFIRKIAKKDPVYTSRDMEIPKLILGGSLLGESTALTTVWGAGIGSLNQKVPQTKRICAVRGPISHARALVDGVDCPPVYGDSGLVLSLLYQPQGKKKYELGIVPHFVDQSMAFPNYSNDSSAKIIDILNPIENVIDDIHACRRILSSSLHGLVVAAAYGIPFQWVKFSNQLAGDGVKFWDFMLSLDLPIRNPIDLMNFPPIYGLMDIPTISVVPDILQSTIEKLWRACPLHEK